MKRTKKLKSVLGAILCFQVAIVACFLGLVSSFGLSKLFINKEVAQAKTLINNKDLYDSKTNEFNTEVYNELIKMLFGDEDPETYIKNNGKAEYDATGSYVVPASVINAKVGDTANGLVITLNGLKWTVTAITIDTRDNIVLTLLSEEDNKLSTKFYTSAANTLGNNIYASSTLRSTLLSNSTFSAFASGAFATKFLVQPQYIKYQETQTQIGRPGSILNNAKYNLPNECYGTRSEWEGIYKTTPLKSTDVFNGVRYDAWKNDYIWVPSATEMGFNDTFFTGASSIWKLSNAQRAHTTGYWTRSGAYNGFAANYVCSASGGYSGASQTVTSTFGVRPAVHLNLGDIKKLTAPKDTTYTYDGTEKKFTQLENFRADLMNITFEDGLDGHTDVGEYYATITLKGDYTFKEDGTTSKRVCIKIVPKPVTTPQDIDFVYDGSPHVFEKLTWYDSDIMSLQYDESYNFIDAKTYSATVTLKSDNYKFATTDERSVAVNLVIKQREITPKDLTLVYDAVDHSNIFAESGWYDASVMTLEIVQGNLIDAGEHKVKITLTNDNIAFSNSSEKEFVVVLVIDKKHISVQPLPITEHGVLRDGESIQTTTVLYERDITNGTAPEFGIEYLKKGGSEWFREVPVNAGGYTARAYIINADDCNYVLDDAGNTEFNKPKETIAVPYFNGITVLPADISGSVTTVQYNGLAQVFKLVNGVDGASLSNINILEFRGGISYSQSTGEFKATAVGIYTVEVGLTDKTNMRWADYMSNSSETRVITLIITKAQLTIEVDDPDGLKTSWEKGEVDAIHLNVLGLANAEIPILNVYYTANGGAAVLVPDEAMQVVDGVLKITINVDNFSANTMYKLYVELADDRDVNKNYTLVNKAEFEFFILQATIKEIIAEWQYNNLINGMGIVLVDGQEIEYNGQEFTVLLDPSKLAKGIIATYTNQIGVNSGSYTTTVTLTCEEGYEFASGLQTVYQINWVITPLKYDLGLLAWGGDFIFDLNNHVMQVINLPSWLDARNAGGSYKNSAVAVGNYTAGYELYADENHIFINASDLDWIVILSGGQSAIITHDWKIEKVTIKVSNAPRQWREIEYLDADSGEYYKVLVPLALTDYDMQLLVEYFTDRDFNNKIDPTQIKLADGLQTFYVRVMLNPEYAESYRVLNALNDTDYAYISFEVGDNRQSITVEHNYVDNKSIYNGQDQPLIPRYISSSFKFGVTYYVQDANGDFTIPLGEGVYPKNAGMYFVVLDILDEQLKNNYRIANKNFIITIEKVTLTTNGWSYSGDLNIPTCNVVSSSAIPDDVFDYKVFDANGNEVVGGLEYGKNYVARLNLLDTVNYQFGEGARTEYEFRPLGGDGDVIILPRPIISHAVLVYNGFDQTFIIDNWDLIKDYVEIISGSLVQFDVNKYTIIITFKSGINVIWEDETTADCVLTFEIIPLEIEQPEAEDIRYTGNEINVLEHLNPYGNWQLWADIIEGNPLQTKVGKYILKFKIKADYIGKIVWKNSAPIVPEELVAFVSIKVTTETNADGEEVIVVEWEIKPALINGSWDDSRVPVFKPENEADADKFEIKYFDQDGNEVLPDQMQDKTKYIARVFLKEEFKNNYEFIDGKNFVELEFEYKVKSNFFKNNWWWLLLILIAIILLIIIIIVAKRKKDKKKKEKAAKKDEPKATQEQPKQDNNSNSVGGQNVSAPQNMQGSQSVQMPMSGGMSVNQTMPYSQVPYQAGQYVQPVVGQGVVQPVQPSSFVQPVAPISQPVMPSAHPEPSVQPASGVQPVMNGVQLTPSSQPTAYVVPGAQTESLQPQMQVVQPVRPTGVQSQTSVGQESLSAFAGVQSSSAKISGTADYSVPNQSYNSSSAEEEKIKMLEAEVERLTNSLNSRLNAQGKSGNVLTAAQIAELQQLIGNSALLQDKTNVNGSPLDRASADSLKVTSNQVNSKILEEIRRLEAKSKEQEERLAKLRAKRLDK